MAQVNKMEGLEEVLRNLRIQREAMAERVGAQLKLSGLFLQRESQLKVPVDFGILKASAFTRATGRGFGTVVTVGYTASYALFVHELIAMKLKGQPRTPPSKGLYWDPQGRAQAKFLEQPFRQLTPRIIQQVRDAAKI